LTIQDFVSSSSRFFLSVRKYLWHMQMLINKGTEYHLSMIQGRWTALRHVLCM
jgi:hypothetical protein